MSGFESCRLRGKVFVGWREFEGLELDHLLGFWVLRFKDDHGREPFWCFGLEPTISTVSKHITNTDHRILRLLPLLPLAMLRQHIDR
jgi:hypothetical protein